jgi:hypothetical protein
VGIIVKFRMLKFEILFSALVGVVTNKYRDFSLIPDLNHCSSLVTTPTKAAKFLNSKSLLKCHLQLHFQDVITDLHSFFAPV